MANKRTLGVSVGAAVVAVVAVLLFHPALKKEETKPPTPQQAAQNECAMKASQEYLKEQQAVTLDPEKLLSVETTLAKRRLQERFCLQLAECDLSEQAPAMTKGVHFSSCLKDEALEEYDAVPREDAEKPGN
jgi:hypothetical protein